MRDRSRSAPTTEEVNAMSHHTAQEGKSSASPGRSMVQRAAQDRMRPADKKCSGCGGSHAAAAAVGAQAKLTVNEPGDSLEREADHVADQVMSMPAAEAPAHAPTLAGGRTPAGVQA